MKGIEDLITAVSKLSMTKPDISLIIIGHGDADYIRSLQEKIINLGLVKNIEFKGFIPSQRDMHLEVMKARIVVLPTYNDTIPGTIVESMLLGLPVISYRTGGIPDLNKENRNIILVEQGNIDGLVQELIILLNNPEMQIKMGETAKAFASEEFDNARSAEILKEIYKDVIRAFKEDKISNNTLLS
jgi:glycosyltransferase involved in cell wall biosynthesis